jgi:uncharacterized protein (TIGR03067 family)
MVATLTLALVAGLVSADDAAEKDLKAMQGKWSVVECVDRGKPLPAKEFEEIEFEFKGATMIARLGNTGHQTTFKLDPSQKPKVIRHIAEEPGKAVVEGIYEIDGDTLKLASTKKIDGKRPTSFELKKGDDVQIFVLKRKK